MKLKKIAKFATAAIFFLLSLACTQKSSLSVSDLKCEYLIDPLGINTKYPRFNWENLSEVRGAHQTAFQIVVATDIDKLSENKADCWNSGKIHSSESILVKYEGLELSPGQLLYWKVKVWDENDKGEPFYADSAYTDGPQEEIISQKEMSNQVCEKGYRNKPLTDEQKASNTEKSRVRSRVEHIFGFMENSMNQMYIRSIGIKRVAAL